MNYCPVCKCLAIQKPLFHMGTFPWCETCKEDLDIIKKNYKNPETGYKSFNLGDLVQYRRPDGQLQGHLLSLDCFYTVEQVFDIYSTTKISLKGIEFCIFDAHAFDKVELFT